jgi:hypothetical protein
VLSYLINANFISPFMFAIFGAGREPRGAAAEVYSDAHRGLSRAPLLELVTKKQVSRVTYRHACLEGSAVAAYQRTGIEIAPWMTLAYVVRDAKRHVVDPVWGPVGADLH